MMPLEKIDRFRRLQQWTSLLLKTNNLIWSILPGDASTRNYYRCIYNNQTYIVVDSPPSSQNNSFFVEITNFYTQNKVLVPNIYKGNLEEGFFIITDFGDVLYLNVLNTTSADKLYQNAIDTLFTLQTIPELQYRFLPSFAREKMQYELSLFVDWFLKKELNLLISENDKFLLNDTFERLIILIENQPNIIIHRDYHSRNLMCLPNHKVGVIDFQDSSIGPLTYDLVSLLRDCYIDWPDQKVQQWIKYYFENASIRKLIPSGIDLATFKQWFDWMGVQRHLKAIGIFARLYHRDQKSQYIGYIPRTLKYVKSVTSRYDFLNIFHDWLHERTTNFGQEKNG